MAKGVKFDCGKPKMHLVIGSFSRALIEVGKVATYGAMKYSDDGWITVPDGLCRYTDAMLRHYLAEARGEKVDEETGFPHAAAVAWNALARLDLMLREEGRLSKEKEKQNEKT